MTALRVELGVQIEEIELTAIQNFLAMGGYAFFVWPPYLLTALFMLVLAVVSIRDLHRQQRLLESMEGKQAEAAPIGTAVTENS